MKITDPVKPQPSSLDVEREYIEGVLLLKGRGYRCDPTDFGMIVFRDGRQVCRASRLGDNWLFDGKQVPYVDAATHIDYR